MNSAVAPDDFLAALLYQFSAMLQMEAALERICALIAVVGGSVVLLMLLREVRERREKRDSVKAAAGRVSGAGASHGAYTQGVAVGLPHTSTSLRSRSETEAL